MARAIFISYRRNDSEGEAGRLFDDLVRVFGEDSVFMDVAGISPGIDFRKAIDDNVATCGVLLAIIGPQWVSVTDTTGKRRLDDDNDFVRLETASALARNIPVIPVLVHDAKMPHPEDLPDNLKELAYRNSVELTHARWNSDVQLLTNALRQYVGSGSGASTQPVHATVPVQLPAPNPPAARDTPEKASKTPLIMGLSLGAVLLLLLMGFFLMHSRSQDRKPAEPISTSPAADPASAPGNASGPALSGQPSNPNSPPAPAGKLAAAGRVAKPLAPATPVSSGQPISSPSDSLNTPTSSDRTGESATASNGLSSVSGPSALVGTWTNPMPARGNALFRLQVSRAGNGFLVHAWATDCVSCDWGSVPARSDGAALAAVWTFPGAQPGDVPERIANVTLKSQGGTLSVHIKNTFPNYAPTEHLFQFVRVQ